jgi:hypothetical protein
MFGANSFDFAVDVEEAFSKVCEMTWCHQSQIMEWLPWVGRHNMATPKSKEEWSVMLGERFGRQRRELGIKTKRAVEVFTVTAWGEVPHYRQVLDDFPKIMGPGPNLARLRKRLALWRSC